MRFFSIVFGVSVFLAACNNEITVPSGTSYEVVDKGDGKDTASAKEGDILVLSLKMSLEDSVFFDSKEETKKDAIRYPEGKFKVPFMDGIYPGDPFAIIGSLNVGDSVVIKCKARYLFRNLFNAGVKPGDEDKDAYVYARLIKVESFEESMKINKDKALKNKEAEVGELGNYLSKNNITTPADSSGLIFIEKKAGTGKQATAGKYVTVKYTGKLLNGKVFDTSEGREPLEFKLGAGEVIPAWDLGIAKLKEGGQAQLICPSKIAYGERGSGDRIPPFSPLVFDVELVKVSDTPTQPER